jgi:hypothetical protein
MSSELSNPVLISESSTNVPFKKLRAGIHRLVQLHRNRHPNPIRHTGASRYPADFRDSGFHRNDVPRFRSLYCVNMCFLFAIFGALALIISHMTPCRAAQITEQTANQLQPTALPEAICVADFAIDTAAVKEDSGIRGTGGPLQGRLGERLDLLHRHESPQTKARELVNLLADSLTRDLWNYQLPAKRLLPGKSPPKKGWVITGQFLEVDEGNRLRRAIIGFGAGATEMQIEVNVTDESRHPGSPFLVMGSTTGSGKMPGAAVTLNPYVAAAKFVLAKNASDKDVIHAASNIASEIVKYLKTLGLLR